MLSDEIKKFVHTGKYKFANQEDHQKSTQSRTERQSLLGNTLLFKPREFIGSLHQKTHFKAGETIQVNVSG